MTIPVKFRREDGSYGTMQIALEENNREFTLKAWAFAYDWCIERECELVSIGGAEDNG